MNKPHDYRQNSPLPVDQSNVMSPMLQDSIEGFRLSPQQRSLWSLQQSSLQQNHDVYRSQIVLRLAGTISPDRLKTAVQQVVERHESLRTTFQRRPGVKMPLQVIRDRLQPQWRYFNWGDLDPAAQQTQLQDWVNSERYAKVDYAQDSPLRIVLVSLSPSRHCFIATLPTLCADAISLTNLADEVFHRYLTSQTGATNADAEAVQYLQFSEWQNELLEEAANTPSTPPPKPLSAPTLTLPLEQTATADFSPTVYGFKLSTEIANQAISIAQRTNTPLSTVLLTSWQILLWRLTHSSPLAISVVLENREYEELRGMIGLMAKSLPVRCNLKPDLSFWECLEQTQAAVSAVQAHQDTFVPEATPQATHTPVSFEFVPWATAYPARNQAIALEQLSVCRDRGKVKLTVVQQDDLLTVLFQYDQQQFQPDAIQRLAQQFQTVFAQATATPQAAIQTLDLLTESDRQQLLVEFNATQKAFPVAQGIHQLMEAQAVQYPDRVAIAYEDQRLTYGELHERTNQLAHYLKALGVGAEVVVGIYLERSPLFLVGLLGVLKAGGAYLPLDPAFPTESIGRRLQTAGAKVLLTQSALAARSPAFAGSLVQLDLEGEAIAQCSRQSLACESQPDQLAYVLFTSGSTGQPKGVAVEHRQILNYLYGILDVLDLPAAAQFAIVSTFAADLGHTMLFPALCTGGCLHIISEERAANAQALAAYFQRQAIDCLKIVPSHLAALLASGPTPGILPKRWLILGGEAVRGALVEQIQPLRSDTCQILNHYGPTETTVGVLTHKIGADQLGETVPLGRPLANTRIYILDEQRQPVPIGVPGELYIGGAGVARGYLNSPEQTAARFITHSFQDQPERLYRTGDRARYRPDGAIEFLGRMDDQIKVRGFRLEPAEIEVALQQHPAVQQAVVTVWAETLADQRLVAYLVATPGHSLDLNEVRPFLRGQLPAYMQPSIYMPLKALPLTPNGKVDRRSLPAPDTTRPDLAATYVAPQTDIERQIVTLWQEVLHLEKVGIDDNFFDLGGHSLLMVQVHSQLCQIFGPALSITDLFRYPTVSALADHLSPQASTAASTVAPLAQSQNRAESRLTSRRQRSQVRQQRASHQEGTSR